MKMILGVHWHWSICIIVLQKAQKDLLARMLEALHMLNQNKLLIHAAWLVSLKCWLLELCSATLLAFIVLPISKGPEASVSKRWTMPRSSDLSKQRPFWSFVALKRLNYYGQKITQQSKRTTGVEQCVCPLPLDGGSTNSVLFPVYNGTDNSIHHNHMVEFCSRSWSKKPGVSLTKQLTKCTETMQHAIPTSSRKENWFYLWDSVIWQKLPKHNAGIQILSHLW